MIKKTKTLLARERGFPVKEYLFERRWGLLVKCFLPALFLGQTDRQNCQSQGFPTLSDWLSSHWVFFTSSSTSSFSCYSPSSSVSFVSWASYCHNTYSLPHVVVASEILRGHWYSVYAVVTQCIPWCVAKKWCTTNRVTHPEICLIQYCAPIEPKGRKGTH